MRVGSSFLRSPFPFLPSSHCFGTTLNFLLDREKQIPFTSYPNGIIKAKLEKWQGAEVSAICKALFCQQNLGDSYWLLLKDIFWNFSPIRLKFALDVHLSASTAQQASGLFSGMLMFQLSLWWFQALPQNYPSLLSVIYPNPAPKAEILKMWVQRTWL